MMKRKHRIIPIVLEDISRLSSIMDKSLKAIISAVTYLEWPMESDSKKIDKFWKRLQLSLPKKKVADTEPSLDSNGTSLTDLSSTCSNITSPCSILFCQPINKIDFGNYANTFNCEAERHKPTDNDETGETIYDEITELNRSICIPIKCVSVGEDQV
ncbi:hypothetical protein DPMN_030841 [Dreissena polymorpha]|uniref:Uncharacterized protein n=1 Tax=Dreissena polymorpha TaxID=45954 RepID=A0A9D4M1I0_DREPO|nr:hypothetical protein DPMN_030841 [Dreissena polymorpha]